MDSQFKIFLGLELEKNVGTTLNQEITKLTKNGINLKVGLDDTSLKTLTTAINSITQQLQKMNTLGSNAGKGVANGFKEANKETADQLVRLREITQEYKNGSRSAEDYANKIKGMIFNKDGGLSAPAMKVPVEEMTEYISLLKQIQGNNTIKPIGDLVSTKDVETVKLGMTELVRRVETYSDGMGRVQTITSLVGKETGELVATQQTLTTNQEKGLTAIENQRASLEKYRTVMKEIANSNINIINSGKATSSDNEMFAKANEIKKEYEEIMSISQQGILVEDSRIAKFKRLVAEQQSLISLKEKEIAKDKALETSLQNRDRVTRQMQALFSSGVSNYSTGVNDEESQQIQKLITDYSNLNVTRNDMTLQTKQLEEAVKSYVNKIKETATVEQKQQVATEKHAIAVQKLQNAFKNTNSKYSIGVDTAKSSGMEDQINALKQLDPLADGYAQDLERIRMNLSQYTIETRENANAINSQFSNIAKLKQLQDSLNTTKTKTDGFYNVDQANSLQNTLNQMREMIASGQDVSNMLKLIGADVSKFGKDSTSAMRESTKALKEEQQLYLYKEKMLTKLSLLEQKYKSKNMDTTGIQNTRVQVMELSTSTDQLTNKVNQLDVSFSKLSGAYQMKKIGTSMRSVLGMATGFYGLYSVFGYLRQGMSSIISETTALDDAMIGLTRVTDETTATYDTFRKSAFETANEIGGSAKEIVDSTSEFAKLGFEFSEATKLATDATKYATAGEIALTEATDALSASYTVFGGTIDETMGKVVDSTAIIDLYNKIGNTMAVTSGDIGIAMKASANSLSVANNSLSESVALIATANKTVQDSSKVGNALRTISMRIRGVNEETGELLPKMQELISVGTNGKVDIMDGENFKSTYQIMLEISEVWDELSDKQQAYLAENVAGKNRAEVFMALMGNAEDLTYAMEMAEDSIGSVDEEMAIVMQTFEKRVEVMKNAWSSLANTTLNSDLVKDTVDLTTAMIKLADACGGLVPVLASVGVGIAVFKFAPLVTGVQKLTTAINAFGLVTAGTTVSVKALNLALSVGVIGVASVAIMGLGYALNYASKEAERTREKIEGLKEDITQAKEGISSLNSIGTEYETLSTKSNLTTKEAERLYEVQNEIKNILPDIGGYYDEQGNFIITQVSTSKELLDIQKEILKNKKEELVLESEKQIDNLKSQYEGYEDLIQKIGEYSELMNQTDLGGSDKRVANALKTNLEFFGIDVDDLDGELSTLKSKMSSVTQDIHDYLLNSLTTDSAWDGLGENMANAIRKALSEMSYDQIIGYATELKEGNITTKDFIETLKTMPSVIKATQDSIKETSTYISETEEPISSLSVVAEQVTENLDILKVSLNELNSTNDISEATMEKLIKKYPELADKITGVESAYQALNQKLAENEFDNATDGIADLVSILEDLEAGNGITASSFKKISENFPELLAYMNDEASLTDAIKSKMNALKEVQNDAYRQMLMSSKEYYEQNILGNEQMIKSISSGIESLFKGLGTAYEGDLKNWKSLADGKADIEKQLINALNEAWGSHFSTLMTQFNKMANTPIATPTFDEASYEANLKSTNPLMARNEDWLKVQIANAKAQFNSQASEYQAYQAEIVKKNQELSKMFDFEFDTVDIKVGGTKASSSGSSSSSAKASYVASIFQEIVDDILKGGEDIEKAMDETQAKLDNAILIGDSDLEEQLTSKMSNLRVQLRDKQTSMVSELEKQIAEMAKVLSNSGALKGYDIANLDSRDLAEVVQNIDKQINTATLAGKDSEVDRLNGIKSLINDVGSVYISTIEKRDEVSIEYYNKENERLEAFAENLDKFYQKKFDSLDREDKILELRKSMLLEDGGEYDKEEKDADKILDINTKLLNNLVKRRALCESQIAQLRAKGFSDESEQIQNLIDEWLDYEQARLDMIKEIAEAKRQNAIDSAQNELDDLTEAKDNINSLLDMTIDMLKKETELKKEALKEQTDDKKEALKEEYDAEKEALEDKLDLLKKEADARKEALDREKDERDYQANIEEKQKEIATVRQQILELSNDNSDSSIKKRKELEAELDKYLKELEDLQYDRSVELQKQAIEDELKSQEDKINNELDNLEDQYNEELEKLEEKYDAELKEYEDYLNNQGKLKEEANKLIESKDKAFYERLKTYAMDYTDTTQAEFEDCWNKAYEALDKYGNKQLDVIEVIEQMTQKVIELNAEIKNLNDSTYKDFIEDDSSTSGDDYDFAGDKGNSSSSSDKKVDEQRDEIVKKMNANSEKWFDASDSEKQRLEEENKKLAKEIGAWQANQDGDGYKAGEWVVKINKKLVPVKKAYGVRHTGLKTGEVGSPWGTFKVKSNEELNKLKDGEIVLNESDTGRIMENVKSLAQGSRSADGLTVVVDMHDFSVTEDSLPKFERLLKDRVPKIINESLLNKGIK